MIPILVMGASSLKLARQAQIKGVKIDLIDNGMRYKL
jgi:hypothetical protein